MSGPGGDVIQVDPQVVDRARRECADFADDFAAVHRAVTQDAALVREGAGQFADVVREGTQVFEASWMIVTDVAQTSADTIATNMGALTLDLSEMDQKFI